MTIYLELRDEIWIVVRLGQPRVQDLLADPERDQLGREAGEPSSRPSAKRYSKAMFLQQRSHIGFNS
jgi:hypothetical protein